MKVPLSAALRPRFLFSCILLLGLFLFPAFSSIAMAAESAGEAPELGKILPLWMGLPFVGILLSIALCPLINSHWWEHNEAKVSLFWALAFFVPFAMLTDFSTAFYQSLHVYIIDYIPFIILLVSLFTISGGIIVRGSLRGTPLFNCILLLIGTLLASWIGTTGASMLMVRPVIRANAFRKAKAHVLIFFIFLVSNIGGCLTPLGDPPLFLGFLHGVPFFWTMRLLIPFAVTTAIVTVIFYMVDSYFFRKEQLQPVDAAASNDTKDPIRVEGLFNFLLLGGVVAAVVVSGVFGKDPMFFNAKAGSYTGIGVLTLHGHTLVMPYINILRDGFILLMGFLSLKLTPQLVREDNHFTWGPMKEVGILFAGIFLTIIPPMAILQARGAEFGVTQPWQFFWASGILSSFLDNAPTYLTFLSVGVGLGAKTGLVTDMGIVPEQILMAVSCGSVFMGANSYIGNAPNFMVKSIAEENGVAMPSFFGYMAWSCAILVPSFLIVTFLFFL